MAQNVEAGRDLGLAVRCGRCPNRRIVTRMRADGDGMVAIAWYLSHGRWRRRDNRWEPPSVELSGPWEPQGNMTVSDNIVWLRLDPAWQTPTTPTTVTVGCRRHPRQVRLDRLLRVVAEAERDELVTFVDL